MTIVVLSWWQSWPILFHRFTEHARMKGDHFSNLSAASASSSSSSSSSERSPLHPKFAATEQNCQLVYQPRFHSMIHCIVTRGGEDDSFDQVLSQTEQTENTEHGNSWAYCQLTINAPARGGEYRGILLELSKPFTKFTRNLHLASGLVLFGSRPGMPNIESIHGVSQHIDPQVVKSEATHMTGPGSLSLQIIHWFFALQRENDHHSKRNIPNKYAACFHMKY